MQQGEEIPFGGIKTAELFIDFGDEKGDVVLSLGDVQKLAQVMDLAVC